jgi:hypothetical protein
MKASTRKRLPASKFVYPKAKKYPIDTKKRARAALAYSARKDTYGSYSTVARAVRKRYPSITTKGKKR